jgi:RHS repeat-associated protein
LSSLTGQKSGEANKTYASQLSYAASGAMTELKLGNNLWEHTSFNARLQPTEIGLGTSQGGIDRLKINYAYGTTDNNGNVQSQTITVPGGPTLSQSYTYDELNRLKVAQEMNTTTPCQDQFNTVIPCWKQTFIYDRYGNRNFDTANTSTGMVSSLLTIDQANNRFTTGQGYILYDNAGNLTRDFNGHSFGYDAENKQVAYDGGATISGGASYLYDGDGKRVKKVNGGSLETTIFVYDAGGQMVAEYTTANQQPTGGTSYLTMDNLGTPRIITDASGSVKARHDYLPFGEELTAGTGGRTQQQGYSSDSVAQKFTGKIRDGETGLDYFLARYYSSSQGRFTSPDPIMISDKQTLNPQLWNLYNYAGNNPLAYTDPTGMERVKLGQHTDEQIKQRQKEIDQQLKKDKSLTKEQKETLKAEKRTLGLEKQGNKIAGEYLAALDTIGERQGLQVSDFTLSTDSANDFKGVQGISGDPGAGGAMFVLVGYSKEIFINTNSNDFKGATGDFTAYDSKGNPIARNNFVNYGGPAAVHERSHRDSPTRTLQNSEGRAYTEQLRVLQKFGPDAFKSKEFYNTAVTHVTNGTKLP